jgi:integrase
MNPRVTDIDETIEAFRLQYQVFHGIGDGTARSWGRQQRTRIADFAEYVDKPMSEWKGEHFLAYLAVKVEAGYHVNTVRKYANQLRSFFAWAYSTSRLTADQYLQLKSVPNPRGSSSQSEPRPYTAAELRQFWTDLDAGLPIPHNAERLRKRWIKGTTKWHRIWRYALRLETEAIVSLALHCGLRHMEIYALTPDDLHYDNEYVVVHGKGGKTRAVPYTEPAREAVRAWLDMRILMRPDEVEATWLSCHGRAWNQRMSTTRFEGLLQARVGDYQLHRFRHTFATERLRHGVPLEIVSRVMGHASTRQTLAYAEILKSDVAREMSRTEADFVKAVMQRAA